MNSMAQRGLRLGVKVQRKKLPGSKSSVAQITSVRSVSKMQVLMFHKNMLVTKPALAYVAFVRLFPYVGQPYVTNKTFLVAELLLAQTALKCTVFVDCQFERIAERVGRNFGPERQPIKQGYEFFGTETGDLVVRSAQLERASDLLVLVLQADVEVVPSGQPIRRLERSPLDVRTDAALRGFDLP